MAFSFYLLLGIAVASSSFLSGFISMCVFFKKNNTFSKKKETFNRGRIAAPISARLPSLISIEIMLLLWYLMCCTPLILFFLLYPHHMDTLHDIIGSIIFVFSFIPLYSTHITRIWLLKLKYNVTSLSMLNQLGVAPWKHLRATIWTKIYYNHKWCHDMRTLLIISIAFDVIITAVYSVLIWLDIRYRFYLNMTIFPCLTLVVIIGIFSLKSLRDPFHIFREEVLTLLIWFVAAVIYFPLTLVLAQVTTAAVDSDSWTIIATFLGATAATAAIIIHFHYNDKSLKTIRKNAPSLGIVVSTKEGLEKFLKFLVSEFSVENLEFFTLSMRWRHRLVLRDQRREKRKQLHDTPPPIDENAEQIDKPSIATMPLKEQISSDTETTSPKKGGIVEMIDSLSSPFSSSQRPVPSNMPLVNLQRKSLNGDAQTQLRALPFPLLTFEFLDRDVAKKKRFHNTITETSYCPEFSKTKTIAAQVTQNTVMRRNRTQSIATKTMASIYFDQYDAMEHNRSGGTSHTTGTLATGSSHGSSKQSKQKSKSYRLKPLSTPTHGPISVDTDEEGDPDDETVAMERELIHELSYDITGAVAKGKGSEKITPFVRPVDHIKVRLNSSMDEPAEFELAPMNATALELKEEIEFEDSDSEERRKVRARPKDTLSVTTDGAIKRWDTDNDQEIIQHGQMRPVMEDILSDRTDKLSVKHTKQRNDVTFGGWLDDSFDVYDDGWTQEFMQQKRVDYDRFVTLSEDINVSFEARVRLRGFFKQYQTVKAFKHVEIAKYDVAFERGWRDVWENLNDSLRRFHQSKFYKEWLQSDAADGLNVLSTVHVKKK